MGNSNNSTIINQVVQEDKTTKFQDPVVQERRTIKFQEPEIKFQITKPEQESYSDSSSDSSSDSNNNLQILYVSPLSYNKQEHECETRKRQFSASLYETRKNKLFNKYENDIRNILSIYKILDKYYNFDYKLLSEKKKKTINDKILIYHTNPKFIDNKIYKNMCDYNFQFLAYFYYYLGKALKILNQTVNNTYNLYVIEEAKNSYVEYQNYLENRLEQQHNKEIWTRIN